MLASSASACHAGRKTATSAEPPERADGTSTGAHAASSLTEPKIDAATSSVSTSTPKMTPFVPRATRKGSDKLTTFNGDEELIAYLRSKDLIYEAPDPKKNIEGVWGSQPNAASDALSGALSVSGSGSGAGSLGHGSGISAQGNMWGGSTGAASGASVPMTNTQHVGIDEGDIVKRTATHLIVLRRGRLFSIRLTDLTVTSTANAFGPGIDPKNTWYDEMLVHEGKIVVVGYSYEREGTELGVFDLDATGNITARSTYQLRSEDYFSSRNYATRLIGDKLILYAPQTVGGTEKAPLAWLPALRRWVSGVAKPPAFVPILSAKRIYRPLLTNTIANGITLHTVTICDLAKRDMSCVAQGVLGPPARTFYVSPTSVYVWMTPTPSDTPTSTQATATTPAESMAMRLPLDGGAPTVLGAVGGPVDPLSFLEKDGFLNVMLRADVDGDGMLGPEATFGEAALLRAPLSSFQTALVDAPASMYRALPTPVGMTMQNRFVGDWLLYGTGTSYARPRPAEDGRLFALRVGSQDRPNVLPLGHPIDRIEPMDSDALVVGADARNLHFSPVSLASATAAAGTRYTRRGASQGELRTHGFFYRPGPESRKGIFGLPVREGGEAGHSSLVFGSASIQFVRNDGLVLRDAGSLDARAPAKAVDDGCRASCVDWYGNARPIFVDDRVLALLGYEIVEGKVDPATSAIRETRRVSFLPRPP